MGTPEIKRILELEKIVSQKEKYFIRMSRGEPYCPGGGDGHSFKDVVEYDETPVYGQRYVNSKEKRTAATKELEIIYKTTLDENVRKLADEKLKKLTPIVHWFRTKLGR